MQVLRLLIALSFIVSFSAQAMDIQVKEGYIRAVPPTSAVTAAFMEVHNQGNKARALVSASSAAAEAVELHTHTNIDGVMQMRQVEKIDLQAKSTTHLKPGGLHIMLIGLKAPLQTDELVLINVTLDDGSLLELNLPVRKMAGRGHMHQHHEHQHERHQSMPRQNRSKNIQNN